MITLDESLNHLTYNQIFNETTFLKSLEIGRSYVVALAEKYSVETKVNFIEKEVKGEIPVVW